MADIVDRPTRSRMMAGVRQSHTGPERMLRSGLHRLGFRFRLQGRGLPGTPDIVLPKYRAVLFAHGCFWHGHDCHLFAWPATRAEFWQAKIAQNRARDRRVVQALLDAGWRVGVVHECALKGRARLAPEAVLAALADWLRSEESHIDLAGRRRGPPPHQPPKRGQCPATVPSRKTA